MNLGLAIVGGTMGAIGASLFVYVALIPHRIEVRGRAVTATSLLRTRRFELPPDARLEYEIQSRPKGKFVRVFAGPQVLLRIVPLRDEPRYGAFVRAVQSGGEGTLVYPKAFMWTLVAPFLLAGAVLFTAAFS